MFTAVTLHGEPAAALGSNRNAVYKTLFEARRILRARLAADGNILRTFREPPGPVRPGWMICSPQTRGDTGCDLAFYVLDRYAEAELNGTDPESRFPGVATHLRRCEACHQDYDGLLTAVEGLRISTSPGWGRFVPV